MIFPHSWPAALIKQTTYNNCERDRQAVTQALENTSRDHVSTSGFTLVQFLEQALGSPTTEAKKMHRIFCGTSEKGCIYYFVWKLCLGPEVAGKSVGLLFGVFDQLTCLAYIRNR